MQPIKQRKLDHVEIVSNQAEMDRSMNYFDQIRLTHRALPEINLSEVDPSCRFMGKQLAFPLLISSMTGGGDQELIKINHNLAAAAEAERVALAVGSQRILFNDPKAANSFSLRSVAPSTLLFANIGAVQLNYGMGATACQKAVDILGADGLYLHLNPLQEAIQPEGDTNFANLRQKIAALSRAVSCPLLVKEVGSGFSSADIEQLVDAGVNYFDVAGSGGTSWSLIESQRSNCSELGEAFKDWGIPTPLALKNLSAMQNKSVLIASGGVRTGIDMVKCMILGASLCGMARPFLQPAQESVEAVRCVIQRIKREFVTALFLLGAHSVQNIFSREELILNENWD